MRGYDRINSYLPDELISEVFRRLDSKPARDACSVVCKRWLRLERLSRSAIRIGASGNPDLFVKLMSSRFVNATSVSVDERLSISLPVPLGRRRGGDQSSPSSLKLHRMIDSNGSDDGEMAYSLSDVGLISLGEGFKKLEKLSLIWCSNVTNMGLKTLAENCRSLKALDLQGCYVGDEGLAAVGECCKQLEDLNLRFCEGLTDAGLVKLALGCGKSLKALGVAACARVTDKSLVARGMLANLSRYCPWILNSSRTWGCLLLPKDVVI